MEIAVHLLATLRQDRFRSRTMTVPPGSTLVDLCERLSMQPGEVAIFLVNGSTTSRDRVFQPGDEVALLPAIGGG